LVQAKVLYFFPGYNKQNPCSNKHSYFNFDQNKAKNVFNKDIFILFKTQNKKYC
jgi:hypothetical protein